MARFTSDDKRLATNQELFFGDSQDASVQFDGTNFVIEAGANGIQVGTSTSSPIGLWGVTPVTQPGASGETAGFTVEAGTAVNVASTFTGNTGTTAYTIGDMVAALKALGALAD